LTFLRGAASQERTRAHLAALEVLWVGVRCDPVTAAGREIARGDRGTGMAASQAEMVHRDGVYDLKVDTSHAESSGLRPHDCRPRPRMTIRLRHPAGVDDVVSAAHAAIVARYWAALRLLLHPYLHWTDSDGHVLRGRGKVLAMLERVDAPAPPSAVELRDGQIYRWHG
jgi:hypothetical protein